MNCSVKNDVRLVCCVQHLFSAVMQCNMHNSDLINKYIIYNALLNSNSKGKVTVQ